MSSGPASRTLSVGPRFGTVFSMTASFGSDDYALTVGQITMTTEGGGIVHPEDAAYATEGITYYAEIRNDTHQYLGPFEVHFTVDGESIAAWGGMSHQGVPPNESVWVNGYTERLSVGSHTLHVKVEPGDTLFRGGEQTLPINVLAPRSRRTLQEGDEAGHSGWSQRQVYIIVRDYAGAGFDSEAYVTFSGPGGEASERGEIVDGNLTLDNVWVPDEGNLVLTVTTNQQQHPTLEGTTGFKVDGNSLRLNFMQGKRIIEESWSDMEEFSNKVGVTGSAGVDFKIWKFGAEVSYERTWGESHTEAQSYEVWVPTGQLEDMAHDSARNR